jgi:DNA-binding transcriptional MerR regulator
MLDPEDNLELPPIPSKRYFTIGEVVSCAGQFLCRYWSRSSPSCRSRRGNRRYYQRHDVMLIRQIRSLLYVDGFTISGARNKLVVENDLSDPNQRSAVIHQLIQELEDVLALLGPRKA